MDLKYNCPICGIEDSLPDFVEKVFPSSKVLCSKCGKFMQSENCKKKEEVMNSAEHPSDPRPDLKDDAYLWIELMKRLYKINQEIYYTFHGLRCGGCKLELKNSKLEFSFSDEFTDVMIKDIREHYIKPNVSIINVVMSKLAKDIVYNQSLKDCPI